jgi:hypothetical protein
MQTVLTVLTNNEKSPRTLHFGRRQMYWECYTASCCESFPSGAPFFNPSSIKMQVAKPIERYSELTKVRNAMLVMLLVLNCANSYNS